MRQWSGMRIMPATSLTRDRKNSIHQLRVDAWVEKLMHMVLGATMTQVALCRFLIRESVIDRRRVLAFLEDRGVQWSKTSSDEALLPLVTVLTRIKSVEEPDFPVASLRANVRSVWQVPRRRTEKCANPAQGDQTRRGHSPSGSQNRALDETLRPRRSRNYADCWQSACSSSASGSSG